MEIIAVGEVPWRFTLGVGSAFVAGVMLIVAGRLVKRRLLQEVLRDLGIAFVVAAAVSFFFEFSTRAVEEHEQHRQVLAEYFAQHLPEGTWAEIQGQLLDRKVVRRNVEIVVKLTREAPGQDSVTVPPNRAVLDMSYSYNLASLASGRSQSSVSHELDWAMRDEALDLPRFESVVVTGEGTSYIKQYDAAAIKRFTKQGILRLDGASAVRLPPPGEGSVNIRTERYELVSIPGTYYLIMPELAVPGTAPDQSPAVNVQVDNRLDDVRVDVKTYYEANEFSKATPTNWVLNKTMLPGQGLTVIFTKK